MQVNTGPNHFVPGVKVFSNLPLQILLYFNAFYAPLWAISVVLGLVLKFQYLVTHYKVVSIVVYLFMFLLEPVRLYLGYEGNLREKVPELAGFWLTSLFQLCLSIYLVANADTIILPLETAADIPLIAFLLLEVIVAVWAIKVFLNAQAIKFHLMRLDAIGPHSQPKSEEIEMETLEHLHKD